MTTLLNISTLHFIVVENTLISEYVLNEYLQYIYMYCECQNLTAFLPVKSFESGKLWKNPKFKDKKWNRKWKPFLQEQSQSFY